MKQKHSCPYCGNNPVPHYLNWYFDSLNILFEKLQITALANPIARFLTRFEDDLSLFLIGFGRLLGCITLEKKPHKTTLDRAKVLWEEAEKRGLEMRQVKMLDKWTDLFIVRKIFPNKRKVIVFMGIPRPKDVDQGALATMDDKGVFKKKCLEHDLPVAQGGVAFNYTEAVKIFDRIKKPVIVKPRLGSRGRHAITYIRNHDDLYHAFHIARQLCLWVIVEEQIIGPVYRGTVIDYHIEGVLAGTQPSVTGDGKSSLTKLIQKKNTSRHAEISEILPDEKMRWYITRQRSWKDGEHAEKVPWKISKENPETRKFFDTTIPHKGEQIYLNEKIGVSYGGGSSEDFEICHPENLLLFEKAAKVFGDVIVGFDFMIPDISKSWKTQQCGFLEANSVPFINLHHHPLEGKPRNIASKVWDLMGM